MFIKEEVKKLGLHIKNNPCKWKQTYFCYESENLEIWTANGILFIDMYPRIGMFNIFEKYYIKNCIKIAKLKKLNKSINNN
jgi:hypothetical protein